jgi:hypothetical protein
MPTSSRPSPARHRCAANSTSNRPPSATCAGWQSRPHGSAATSARSLCATPRDQNNEGRIYKVRLPFTSGNTDAHQAPEQAATGPLRHYRAGQREDLPTVCLSALLRNCFGQPPFMSLRCQRQWAPKPHSYPHASQRTENIEQLIDTGYRGRVPRSVFRPLQSPSPRLWHRSPRGGGAS